MKEEYTDIKIKEDLLESLSEKEKELALKILQEFGEQGNSSTYNDLIFDDYKEIPVDIETFLTDDKYLGKPWKDSYGKSKVYPFWLGVLKEIFPNNIDTDYDTLLESGARGLGKSEIACGAVCAYLMYRVMCLKNPLEYYHMKLTEKIAFAFMNIKLELSEAIAVDKFQKTIQMSPWFMSKGKMTQRNNQPYWNPPDPIEIIIGSQADDVIGRPIFFAFFDEVSFMKNKDVEEQKKKALNMIDTAIGGMKTRFVHKGKNPTLLVVASSKKSEQSFMESYIRQLKETQGDNTYIVDEPVWKVKPKGTYSEETFFIGLGNKFLDSIVIPDSDKDKIKEYEAKGYQIIEAPIDFRAKALEDLDRTLCDYAGISSFTSNKFLSAERLSDVVSDEIHNPMPDKITVGNGKDDDVQYSDFFKLDLLDKKYMNKPLFIHLDMSISGDKTGIAGVWIIGKKPTSDGNSGKDLFFQPAFSFSVEAPKGRQISFEKNRNFIRWLRDQGFRVRSITSDTFQSYDLQQQLKAEGFNCDILSVDRVETTPGEKGGVCRPYQYIKNTIYENRIRLYKTELLYNEYVQLEKNNDTGKVDHPPKGCFTGDTKVSLVDGRELTFLELVKEFNEGKVNYVYSMNLDTNKIEPRKITNAWCTQKNAKLIKVTLDNGEVIKCTLNHRFMLRNGEYCEAQDLLPGDSLMPLYRKVSDNGLEGYRMYYEPFEDEWHYEHRKFATDVLDEKYLVHHIDCNKLNNNSTNLIWMSKEQHNIVHSNNGTGAFSKEVNDKRKATLSQYYIDNKNNPTFIERNKKISETLTNKEKLQERQDWISLLESTFNVNYDELSLKERCSYGVKLNRIIHPEVQKTISEQVSKNHKLGKYINSNKALKNCNDLNKQLKLLFPNIDREEFVKLFGFDYDSLDKSNKGVWSNRYRQKMYDLVNHKVSSIEFIDECEDVYDITVEHNHNFALSCGIFVHNSKDQADAMTGAVYNASKYADEFAHDYGEDFEIILKTNEKSTSNDIRQMTVDFEEELKKMGPNLGKPIGQSEEDKNKQTVYNPYSDVLIW